MSSAVKLSYGSVFSGNVSGYSAPQPLSSDFSNTGIHTYWFSSLSSIIIPCVTSLGDSDDSLNPFGTVILSPFPSINSVFCSRNLPDCIKLLIMCFLHPPLIILILISITSPISPNPLVPSPFRLESFTSVVSRQKSPVLNSSSFSSTIFCLKYITSFASI